MLLLYFSFNISTHLSHQHTQWSKCMLVSLLATYYDLVPSFLQFYKNVHAPLLEWPVWMYKLYLPNPQTHSLKSTDSVLDLGFWVVSGVTIHFFAMDRMICWSQGHVGLSWNLHRDFINMDLLLFSQADAVFPALNESNTLWCYWHPQLKHLVHVCCCIAIATPSMSSEPWF